MGPGLRRDDTLSRPNDDLMTTYCFLRPRRGGRGGRGLRDTRSLLAVLAPAQNLHRQHRGD